MSITESPVVVALDFDDANKALSFVEQISPEDCRLKVGKEMFTYFGPEFVKALCNKGFDVFLDLKFHDIPATTAKACLAAAQLGVWMVNVHCSGGTTMMRTAREMLNDNCAVPPLLIGVTVLTSMDDTDIQQIGIQRPAGEQVIALAGLAQQAGLDGVVCSAQEASLLKSTYGKDFKLITPGIRPIGSAVGDQKRVMTPVQAMQAGSDYLVIGRPVTQANNPKQVLTEINQSLLV
ncbi:orotidine 5'-phosphate decarboxylase [Catenovulum agarivorans DS-2]|uniref:Orotidine 5'-phosphate decarboxylase n=1 Tax=Catenovulum agarivorans DS-2 TaxID=1328313 RepID=W7Q7X0_9ALTE|nr:orotidine-5'-phosphate decarboxylase [Catenovulum agarivorans]EWH08899.1 orotidine 5'-phosphate decarboxylase [Catenovulum agarivorans DS-2]